MVMRANSFPATAIADGAFRAALLLEYLTTVLLVIAVGIALFVAYRIHWQIQIRRLVDMGLSGVVFVSESARWAESLQAWAKREGVAFAPPATALLGTNKHGVRIWKDAQSEILKIPAANVETLIADGDAIVMSFRSTRGDYLVEFRFRPRAASLAGFPTMRPEQVAAVVEELKSGLSAFAD